MKRHLHFYQWFLCLLLFAGSSIAAYSQGRVMSLDELKAGSINKIYPVGGCNASEALACGGDGQILTSYSGAGKGDEWTLEDAGDGCYYLKNELGCYWSSQNNDADGALICTTDQDLAVKVKLTWNDGFQGVCFENQQNERWLYTSRQGGYGWSYTESPNNNVFEVYSSTGSGDVTDYEEDGIKYCLNLEDKTAQVRAGGYYYGDIVIPQAIYFVNDWFRVVSLNDSCFYNCTDLTSITLPDGITSLGNYCFAYCSKLTSITLPAGITSLGIWCFYGCSSLTSITLPDGITSLGEGCFSGCENLTNITLPAGITSLGI